jgi:hypothetical protein
MSYDLSIMADRKYSQMTSRARLASFIASLPNIQPNGYTGFILDDDETRLMEIDPEIVSEDGDSLYRKEGVDMAVVNCVRLHIPYGCFCEDRFDKEYLPTALAIAEFLGWTLLDEQTAETWPPS